MQILQGPIWLIRESKNQPIKTVECRNVCKQVLTLDQFKGSRSQGRDKNGNCVYAKWEALWSYG